MKNRIPIILFVLLLAVGAGWFMMKSEILSQYFSSVTSREKVVYYCPMHPTYTSDRPGDCPICNMKLVKREPQAAAQTSSETKDLKKDICYLHNCPHL